MTKQQLSQRGIDHARRANGPGTWSLNAWVSANMPDQHPTSVDMKEVDKALHAERAISRGGKVTYETMLLELPNGSMFEHESIAYLVATHGYLPWSFNGYGAPHQFDPRAVVRVLTPRSIVQAFAKGFTPKVSLCVTAASSL